MMNLGHQSPRWLETAVFYQIYPQSFCDSNGDGIGDIPGILSKLDYISSLGVTALWLNPIFESPFRDGGYDISDFYKVAPRYGTNEELALLFQEAHRRNMKVCLDLVAGHTSDQHPWFRASSQAERGHHSDWYIWTDSVWDSSEANVVRGCSDRDGGYLPNFFAFQPALNYGYAHPDPTKKWQLPTNHPAVQEVREELKRIMKFWLDAGADGFRVDMAPSLVRNDADGKGIRNLWSVYREWLDREYPDAVLISEWSAPRQAIGAGFDIDFLIHCGEPSYHALLGTPWATFHPSHPQIPFFDRSGRGDICPFLDNYWPLLRDTRKRGYLAIPTGNHDFPRPSRNREERDLRGIYAMLFTLPGVPFIYYGDEIGMRWQEGLHAKEGSYAHRTGSRTPMQWTSGPNAGFSFASEDRLYLPVDPLPDAPCVEAQEKDENSLLSLVRRLLDLRRLHPALGNGGEFRPIFAEPSELPFVFERKLGKERYWIAINPAERPTEWILPEEQKLRALEEMGTQLDRRERQTVLRMAGVSFGIFSVQEKNRNDAPGPTPEK